MVERIEFGTLATANSFRDLYERFVAPADNRNEKTVAFRDDTPEPILDRVSIVATAGLAERAVNQGQVALSDIEREEIDFSREGVNVPKAQSIKAIFLSEGIDDWLQESDLTTTVDENRELAANESAADFLSDPDVSPRAGGGPQRGGGAEINLPENPELEQIQSLAESVEQQNQRIRERIRELIDEFGAGDVADAVAGLPAPGDLRQTVDDLLDDPVVAEGFFVQAVRNEVADTLQIIDEDLMITEQGRIEQARETGFEEGRQQTLNRLQEALGQQFDSADEAAQLVRERIRRAQAGGDVLEELSDTFEREIDTAEDAIEAVREESGVEVARQEVLDRLEQSFDAEFESLDDAVTTLNEQLVEAQRRQPTEINLDEPNERAERFISVATGGEDI